jgi:ATP/maltotriose-dependent transcriptional regulator MalT
MQLYSGAFLSILYLTKQNTLRDLINGKGVVSLKGIIKHDLPAIPAQWKRDRIIELMERSLQNALVTVIAPPGYSKTHEVANYFRDADIRLCWMRATKLDNLPEHFWNNHISALSHEFPDITEPLLALGFPDTLAKMDSWLRILSNDIYKSSKRTVFVLDDFDSIDKNEIKVLFDFIVDTGLENFTLILIGRQKTDLDIKALKSGGGVLRITTEHMKFTPEETKDFFSQCGIDLTDYDIRNIYQRTEGWPLLISLLAHHIQADPKSYEKSYEKSLEFVYSIFESDFFSKYDDSMRKILVKLAPFPSFHTDMIEMIGGADPSSFTDMLRNNLFVSYNSNSGEYTFQNNYRDFLIAKQNLFKPRGNAENLQDSRRLCPERRPPPPCRRVLRQKLHV